MKLVRFGPAGEERSGALIDADTIVDLSSEIGDLDATFFASDGVDRARAALSRPSLPRLQRSTVRLGAPILRSGKIVCIGLNYRQHAIESGQPIPAEPIVFMKAPDTIVGPTDDILIPVSSEKTDWEVELAVVIGRTCRYLPDVSAARAHVAGYVLSNDVSERHFQLERGGQWDKGKNCETFNPLGPWIATADEIDDPQSLDMWLSVNGVQRQASTTADMIFPVDHLIWYLSQFMVLHPGDVVNTGTPQGVGLGQNPPTYLRAGDVVELGIDGLGTQRSALVQALASTR
jgi:2-keto-4-pentenoate hydratase/2-oxohepta-3-ene-1,7-dioic acid hydratase in catechol pathway